VNLALDDKQGKSLFGFTHACNGLKSVIRTERNFRIHLVIAFGVILAGLVFRLAIIKWLMIIFAIGLVLITEMLNTAIEKMLDYLKPDIHPSAKMIKDIAAGAVLVSAIIAAVIGLIVFIPEFDSLL
jgi:diacylglycerol kinase